MNEIFAGRSTWNNPDIATAVTTFQDMISKGYFDPAGIALGNDEVKANFIAGKTAFYQNGSWNCGEVNDGEFNFDVALFPVMNEEKATYGQVIGGPNDALAVSAYGEDPALAAEFLAWAKLSQEGEEHIWNDLGFDVCNSALWFDEAFAFDEANPYNTFFRVKPYEVLQDLAEQDAIGTIYTTSVSPTLNDYMCTTTLNEVFEDGMDVEEALAEAQEYIEMETM
jgi:maltose-binding protein MalE